MHFLIEIAAAVLFILSSGLLYNSKYTKNRFLIICAGLFAILSSYFVLKELAGFVKRATEHEPAAHNGVTGDTSHATNGVFEAADLQQLGELADTKHCWEECSNSKYYMVHLPVDDATDGTKSYLVQTTDLSFCGSRGCYNAVMLYKNGRMATVRQGLGITEQQAMIIARDALRHPQTYFK